MASCQDHSSVFLSFQYKDGICDEFLNVDMCCYDGGDCPVAVFYDPLPALCNNDACDHAKLGDGICDKKDENVCCMDQLDCVNTKQVWDDLTCETMSTWTLYDTCPLCCNVSSTVIIIFISIDNCINPKEDGEGGGQDIHFGECSLKPPNISS